MTLVRKNPWGSYANAFVGLWLLMAPLVIHAPTAAGYLNDTLVGVLVITFTVSIMMRMEMEGATVPEGWSYTPSTAGQRAPLIALGLFGVVRLPVHGGLPARPHRRRLGSVFRDRNRSDSRLAGFGGVPGFGRRARRGRVRYRGAASPHRFSVASGSRPRSETPEASRTWSSRWARSIAQRKPERGSNVTLSRRSPGSPALPPRPSGPRRSGTAPTPAGPRAPG